MTSTLIQVNSKERMSNDILKIELFIALSFLTNIGFIVLIM